MNPRIVIVDDFLNDPHLRREIALHSEYKTEVITGLEYPGINVITDPDISDGLEIDGIWTGPSAFRLTLKNEKLPTFIHNDSAIAEMTGILYLNTPGQETGGTAFWTHRATKSIDSSVLNEGNTEQFRADGLNEDAWILDQVVEMKFNRLLLFDSSLWHSPYPREGFGSDVRDGRLIQVYFMSEMKQ